jgi:hypothetical protein
LPPEVYLESARMVHFNPEDQAEARELDANLLEEMRNTTLSNVRRYQAVLKKCYNKSVVQRELHIGDLVLKKDIHTKDKHKFSSPWQGPFIIVDVAAPGAYVLVEVMAVCYQTHGMPISYASIMSDIVSSKNLVFLHV